MSQETAYPVEHRYRALPLNSNGKRAAKVHIAVMGAREAMCGTDLTGTQELVSVVPKKVCARCRPHMALVVRLSAKEAMHRYRESGDNGRHLIDFQLTCRTLECDEHEVWGGFCEACWTVQGRELAA